jgi:transcriptional regulator with XRE-family HTH domain
MEHTLTLGEWITRRRKLLDLTRDEVARRAHCSVSRLRRVEADDLRISPALAESLARVLDVPADQRAAFVARARGENANLPDLKPRTSTTDTASHLPAPMTLGDKEFERAWKQGQSMTIEQAIELAMQYSTQGS